MQIQPYLFFEGRCEEAIELYKEALEAEVTMLMRFKDSPDHQGCVPGDLEKVMHAELKIGDTHLMLSDGKCQTPAAFQGFALSIALADQGQAERYFNALSAGGEVMMPLGATFWSPKFGMVKDRIGILWMINVMP